MIGHIELSLVPCKTLNSTRKLARFFFYSQFAPLLLVAAAELELPPCTREDRWVPLSSVERLVYEQAKRSFVDAAFHFNQQHAAAQHQVCRLAGDSLEKLSHSGAW